METEEVKLCECGCGNPAPISLRTCKRDGCVKGKPVRFIHNHHWRGHHHSEESKEKERQSHLGEKNGMWKGDNITENSGRRRARARYDLVKCELCGEDATERHHRDGNTANNDPPNVQLLCRRCHMIEDGRMNNLKQFQEAGDIGKEEPKCLILLSQSPPEQS
jgi:hypothetical protein